MDCISRVWEVDNSGRLGRAHEKHGMREPDFENDFQFPHVKQ